MTNEGAKVFPDDPLPTDAQPHPVIDEGFLSQWFAFGFRQLDTHLTNAAKFEAVCLSMGVRPYGG